MKRKIYLISIFIFLIFSKNSFAVNQYCSTPPFLQVNLPSNVMLVLDYSGSMGWDAYVDPYITGDKYYKWAYTSNGWIKSWYNPNKTYYGFFKPDVKYSFSQYGYWYENSNGSYLGSYLNWLYMMRIDILRWILTGGYTYGNYVVTSYGEYIKKEDVSSFNSEDGKVEGILQQIEKQTQKPRIGAVFFSTTVFDTIGLSYDYDNLIDKINNDYVGGSTATHLAVEYALEMYKENSTYINYYFNGVDPYKFNVDGNIITVPCAKNFVLLMSDGEWNTSDNRHWCSSTYCDPIRPVDSMWLGGKADLVSSLTGNQKAETYTVSMFANPTDSGTNALKWMAVYGNYYDNDNNGKPYNLGTNSSSVTLTIDGYPDTSLTQTEDLENISDNNEVKKNASDTGPYGFYEGNDPEALKNSIANAFSEILKKMSSGTSASVLATNEKSGTVILQALFYPKRNFDNGTKTSWAGSLNNMWFYLGPFVQNIREDTDKNDILNLFDDYVIQFYFDNSSNTTKVHVWQDSNGDGIPDTFIKDEDTSDVKYLWDAGEILWSTNSADRKIFTDVDNLTYTATQGNFITSNAAQLESYLNADNLTQAQDIIEYIRGKDISGYRDRTVTIGSSTHVWKLGDIIYSTPSIISGEPINSYYKRAPYGYSDNTYKQFIESDEYKNRGMVFVGANDGMLHAFRLGKITMLNSANGNIAKLEKQPANVELGSEAWGFIPKNLLPYLKYYMDKDYCHLYYVDLTPYVFDASIGKPGEYENDYFNQIKTGDDNTWRTILIGGLNFGGACGDNVVGAINPPSGIPSDTGHSSYFALDVTDPENPKVLWEFSDNNLAFTTTGPAIVHIPYKESDGSVNNNKNGYWYIVFASGPDNYDGTIHQPLYLYVLDLKTGKLMHKWQLSGSSCTPSSTLTCQTSLIGNYNAFAGRMFESSVDLGTNYSDDGVYFGYNYYNAGWKGGVVRLVTYDDPNPSDWKVSKLISGIGPITSSVRTLEDSTNHNLWVYFGEGRYFTKEDDASEQRSIYGVKDPCYNGNTYEATCPSALVKTDLTDVTNNANAAINNNGWYINLEVPSNEYNAERMITDPVVSNNGWVFYTTFMPTSDLCGFGGNSYVWMVNYDNGGTPENVEGSLYVQLSTGAIKRIDLKEQFGSTQSGNSSGGRKLSTPLIGSPPPSAGMTIVLPPKPLGQVIHWEEK